jgi:hypothetical protein
MREMERIGNQIEQIQTAMDGLVERLAKLEGAMVALKQDPSKKSFVYIDESTALIGAGSSDIEWVRNKITETELAL